MARNAQMWAQLLLGLFLPTLTAWQLLEFVFPVLQWGRPLYALDHSCNYSLSKLRWFLESERLWHVGQWVGVFFRAERPGASVWPSLWSLSGLHSCLFPLWVLVTTWGPRVGMTSWFSLLGEPTILYHFPNCGKLPCSYLFLSFSLLPQELLSIISSLGLSFENNNKTLKTKKSLLPSSGLFYFSTCNRSQ